GTPAPSGPQLPVDLGPAAVAGRVGRGLDALPNPAEVVHADDQDPSVGVGVYRDMGERPGRQRGPGGPGCRTGGGLGAAPGVAAGVDPDEFERAVAVAGRGDRGDPEVAQLGEGRPVVV